MEGLAATECFPREAPWGQICVRLLSPVPHGPPVGKDDERAYDNTEKGLSAEGMPELGCSSEKVLAMQGAAGVYLIEGTPQVGDVWGGRGLGVSGWQRKQ